MSTTLKRVRIAGTGSFLPGDPVTNDRIDDVLGHLTDAPPRVQQFARTVCRRMLDQSGVESRHFAIHPETRALTHSIAGLAEPAARKALEMAGRQPEDIDFVLISSSTYDRGTPPTSVLLQERLGIDACAEMEVHSNCSGIGKCMQVAYDALRVGRYKTALVVYSQLSSAYLRASYYNQAKMNKTQAALRYILADGAGAVLLEAVDDDAENVQGELLGTYMESIGGKLPPAMMCGGGVEDIMDSRNPIESVYQEGKHHLDQDFSAVNSFAGPRLFEGMLRMFKTLEVKPGRDVDHFVWSIPTMQLFHDNVPGYVEEMGIKAEQLQFRAARSGYCGGASLLIHFDDLVRAGELQRGQTAVVYSVESSKWMSAGFYLRW